MIPPPFFLAQNPLPVHPPAGQPHQEQSGVVKEDETPSGGAEGRDFPVEHKGGRGRLVPNTDHSDNGTRMPTMSDQTILLPSASRSIKCNVTQNPLILRSCKSGRVKSNDIVTERLSFYQMILLPSIL